MGMDRDLRQRLIDMADQDQRTRAELSADGSPYEDYHPRIQALHEEHAALFATILDQHGWPGESLVGNAGAEAAWLIVQYAISRPELQQRALTALQQAVRDGEAPAWQSAMLLDRISVFQGKRQIYGTELHWDATGELCPRPMENPDEVDRRRASVGLCPLAEAVAQQRAVAARRGERPQTPFDQRQAAFEAWAEKTGWREPQPIDG